MPLFLELGPYLAYKKHMNFFSLSDLDIVTPYPRTQYSLMHVKCVLLSACLIEVPVSSSSWSMSWVLIVVERVEAFSMSWSTVLCFSL